jgi:non-heme chloroperoxidase
MSVFDGWRAAMEKDRAQFFVDIPTGPFFGYNRPNTNPSQGLIWSWYQQAMICGFKSAYDCIEIFSTTDMTEDMKGLDIPVLIVHGDDQQVVPIGASAHEGI